MLTLVIASMEDPIQKSFHSTSIFDLKWLGEVFANANSACFMSAVIYASSPDGHLYANEVLVYSAEENKYVWEKYHTFMEKATKVREGVEVSIVTGIDGEPLSTEAFTDRGTKLQL